MAKSNANITFKGNRIKVLGDSITEGQPLPEFVLTGTDMADLTNEAFTGKVLVISVVPSLDTPVCAIQTKRFNKEASRLGDQVKILTVSLDLPFAQKRWCGAEDATAVITASDYKYRNFGNAFGVYLEDLGLLARAVFVVDKTGKVTHVEYVDEVASEPNYDAALSKVESAINS
jgi:thiol peroxidase